MDASHAPAPAPVKRLGERVTYAGPSKPIWSAPLTKTSANPKAQPKSAIATKANAKGADKKAANKARKRDKTVTRPKAKTVEELDADMANYYTNNGSTTMTDTNGMTNGNAQPAATGGEDLGMDEISVSSSIEFIT